MLNQVFDQLETSSDDERRLPKAQRDKLEAERLKLVQAHYADAVPLDLLKTEQDRIAPTSTSSRTSSTASEVVDLTDAYSNKSGGLHPQKTRRNRKGSRSQRARACHLWRLVDLTRT